MSTQPAAVTAAAANKETLATTESFGQMQRRVTETASEALAAQAKATVQARYIMALQNPRDWDVVRQKLLRDCARSSFAATALYKKPVGGTTVTGLSVRFAETALRSMMNVLPESQVIYDDREKRIVRVTVTDLESNVAYSKDLLIEKTVERKTLKDGQLALSVRLNSSGQKVYTVEATEDDMLTKEAALTSKALRQNGLRLVPGDLQDECIETIQATIKSETEKDPDAAKNKLIDAFDELGIRVADLKQFLGVDDLATLTPKDILTLRGVYQAIRDGETNWRELMEQRDGARGAAKEAPASGSKAQEVLNKIKEKAAAGEAPAAPPPQDNPQPTTPAEKPASPQQVISPTDVFDDKKVTEHAKQAQAKLDHQRKTAPKE